MRTKFDRDVCDAVLLKFLNPNLGRVEFQFPPKILTDNRSATWEEGEIIGREPVGNLAKTGPRVMTMNWTYMVEAVDDPNATWTIEKIKTQVNKVRGYFVDINNLNGLRAQLIVVLQYDVVTGRGPWTCRIKDVNVKHSENLVGRAGYVYPVRTDISIDLRLWTTGIPRGGNPLKQVQKIKNLSPDPNFSDLWF